MLDWSSWRDVQVQRQSSVAFVLLADRRPRRLGRIRLDRTPSEGEMDHTNAETLRMLDVNRLTVTGTGQSRGIVRQALNVDEAEETENEKRGVDLVDERSIRARQMQQTGHGTRCECPLDDSGGIATYILLVSVVRDTCLKMSACLNWKRRDAHFHPCHSGRYPSQGPLKGPPLGFPDIKASTDIF